MTGKARRIPERVGDMCEAISHAIADMGALTREEFAVDGKSQRAVIESLIVLGEAANAIMRMDSDIAHTAPDFWQALRDAYDMRIILTHEYFRVDASVVWDTVMNDLPPLDARLCAWSDGGTENPWSVPE